MLKNDLNLCEPELNIYELDQNCLKPSTLIYNGKKCELCTNYVQVQPYKY